MLTKKPDEKMVKPLKTGDVLRAFRSIHIAAPDHASGGIVLSHIIRVISPQDPTNRHECNRIIEWIKAVDEELPLSGLYSENAEGQQEPIPMITQDGPKITVNLYAMALKAEAMRANDPRKFVLMQISECMNAPIPGIPNAFHRR